MFLWPSKPLGMYKTMLHKYRLLRDMSTHMLLENFIHDEDASRELTRDLKKMLGIELSSNCSAILLITIVNSDGFGDGSSIVIRVEEEFQKQFADTAATVFFNAQRQVGCFLVPNNLMAEDARQLGRELIAEVSDYAELACDALEDEGIIVRVACSGITSSMQPKQLYRDALVVQDHCGHGSKRVVTQQDLPEIQNIDHHELALMERRFMSCVIARDFYGAVTAISGIIDMMIAESQPTLEHMRSNIFNRLETVMTICGLDLHPNRQDKEVTNALHSLMRAETFAAMKDCVYDFFAVLDDCCGSVDEADKLVNIREFVKANYTDTSMGAAMICDHFKFSSSYLSRLFKTQTGGGVVEFIHSVRIEEAIKLLEKTEMTINEISTAVGFANRWTFIRAFRNLENMSPTDYRNFIRS